MFSSDISARRYISVGCCNTHSSADTALHFRRMLLKVYAGTFSSAFSPLLRSAGRDTLHPWTGLPIKSLVLTCVVCLEMEEDQLLFLSYTRRLRPSSCVSGKPLLFPPKIRLPSIVLQIQSQRQDPGNYRAVNLFQGSIITPLRRCGIVDGRYAATTIVGRYCAPLHIHQKLRRYAFLQGFSRVRSNLTGRVDPTRPDPRFVSGMLT